MESSDSLSQMPPELWQFILSYIDNNASLLNIMRVSSLYNHLANDEQEWKRRCDARKLSNLFQKSPEQSWKEFYYQPSTPMFPVYGVVLGKTDLQEFLAKGRITGAPTASHLSLQGLQIHSAKSAMQDPIGKKIVRGAMIRKPTQLPQPWIDLGMSWDKTFDELKSLMWRYNKNYQITTLNTSNSTFIGVIQSIAKNEDIYFSIQFGFKEGSLNEISMASLANLQDNYAYFYNDKVIEEN